MKDDIEARSTSVDMYATIKEQIIAGRFAAGMRLTEEGLAVQFGTSRTPVREALRMLVADGFLDFKRNSGTFVRHWSAAEITDIFDLRLVLESEIASLAAARIPVADIARLQQLQDAIEEQGTCLTEENLLRISGLNREFHHVIAAASQSPRLVAMLSNAIEIPIVQRTFHRYDAKHLERSFHHHRELIDAFHAHDMRWAHSIMYCHISSAKMTMVKENRE